MINRHQPSAPHPHRLAEIPSSINKCGKAFAFQRLFCVVPLAKPLPTPVIAAGLHIQKQR
jgi:hypothetical protein